MDKTDTTLNYQALALDIILTAIEDAQSGDPETAMNARKWLETVDMQSLGVDAGITDAQRNFLNCSGRYSQS